LVCAAEFADAPYQGGYILVRGLESQARHGGHRIPQKVLGKPVQRTEDGRLMADICLLASGIWRLVSGFRSSRLP
jgi:hypothetical protein